MRIAIMQSMDLETGRISCDEVRRQISELSRPGDFWILPEVFNTGFMVTEATCCDGTDIMDFFRSLQRQYGISICGSYYCKSGDFYSNRFSVVGLEGEEFHGAKRHPFGDFEKSHIKPAGQMLNFTIDGIRFRAVVCYDLRFPVWCRNSSPFYDVLICVSQWPLSRQADRTLLLAARAMENVAYVVNANGLGSSEVRLPDGKLDLQMPLRQQVAFYDLNPAVVEETRLRKKYLLDADSFELDF